MKDKDIKFQQNKLTTINYYANKYQFQGIQDLTYNEKMQRVYQYEMKNKHSLIDKGKDPITNEIGYFLIMR
jgi:hypothetical protein